MSGRAATVNVIAGDYALSVGRTDMPSPPGWRWVSLTDVARLESGHTPSREHPDYWDGEIPWIGIRDARAHHGGIIVDTAQTVTQAGLDNSAARLLPKGTVCLSRTASVGYVVVMGRDMATSQDFVNWVCGPTVEPAFLQKLLIAENRSLFRFGKGSTHTTIYYPEVKAFNVCLPPLNEQRRIVAKLETLQARSRRAREALDAMPALLETLRHSILAAACEGRLTQPSVGSGSLPSGWRLVPLDELVLAGGIFDGARDHGTQTAEAQNLRASDYTTSGVRVIRLENLGHLSFIASKKTFISEAKYEGLKVSTVREGDILFGSFVEDAVRVCLLPRLDTVAIAKADCFCVRVDRAKVLPEYLALQLASRQTYERLREVVRGATRPRITTKHLRKLVVPVCPPEEQAEIVELVRRRFASAASIATLLRDARDKSETLDQAVLAKAFRGELVPQAPNDEPAATMLARLDGARSMAAPTRAKKGTARVDSGREQQVRP